MIVFLFLRQSHHSSHSEQIHGNTIEQVLLSEREREREKEREREREEKLQRDVLMPHAPKWWLSIA